MQDFENYEIRPREYFKEQSQYDRYKKVWENKPQVVIHETLEFSEPGSHWAVGLASYPAFWVDLFDSKDEAAAFCKYFKFKVKEVKSLPDEVRN